MQVYLDTVGLKDYDKDVDRRAECFTEVWPELQEQKEATDNGGSGSSATDVPDESNDQPSDGTSSSASYIRITSVSIAALGVVLLGIAI